MINFNVGSGAKKLSQMGQFLTISSDTPQIAGFKGQKCRRPVILVLACASPLASAGLSGSGQRGRERERGEDGRMGGVAPHDFLFVHSFCGVFKIVFAFKINRGWNCSSGTERTGYCYSIHFQVFVLVSNTHLC